MKNKIKQIPTLLGLGVLLVGIIAGVYLIRSAPVWFLRASPEMSPKEVMITNISEAGFSVSWVTDSETSGFIKYEDDSRVQLTSGDDRDQLSGSTGSFSTHHVSIKGLKASTNYTFKIGSGGNLYDKNGEPYSVTTAPSIPNNESISDVAHGSVIDQQGNPVEGAIVYLTLANATIQSSITRASGTWVIPLTTARSSDLISYVDYDKDASTEEIKIQAGKDGTATAITSTKLDNPVSPITLGGNYDFRTPGSSPVGSAVQSELPSPDTDLVDQIDSGSDIELEAEPTTQSELDLNQTPSSAPSPTAPAAQLEITNPGQTEEVNTTTPQITGKGPAGQIVQIEIHSETPTSGTVMIGQDGSWDWTPPSNIAPGEHTITATLEDGTTVSKTFTVLADGTSELPSLTSSPSGEISPTPATRSAMPATKSSTLDESGILTPTLTILTMGLGLIVISIFSIRKINWFT